MVSGYSTVMMTTIGVNQPSNCGETEAKNERTGVGKIQPNLLVMLHDLILWKQLKSIVMVRISTKIKL